MTLINQRSQFIQHMRQKEKRRVAGDEGKNRTQIPLALLKYGGFEKTTQRQQISVGEDLNIFL